MMSENTEVATVTDEIVPGGEQTVPLGVGNFEDVAHDPLAAFYPIDVEVIERICRKVCAW